MASREKRPLAPSKSKQKVNNDCTLPTTIDQKNRKGKGQTRQHQIAQDILEAVATGSQVPVKINTGLPRKTAIKNIRRKAKLKTTKSNLIKVKITKKAPIRSLRKTNAETIRGVRGRRTKKSQEEAKNLEIEIENPESDNSAGKIVGAKGNSNSIKTLNTALNTLKNSLKQRKINKYPIRSTEVDNCISEIPEKDSEATNSTVINSRISPKSGRKVKITYKKAQNLDNEDTQDNNSAETESKLNKVCRGGVIKRLIKEKDNSTKAVEDIASSSKNFRLKRNTSKEREIQNNTRTANSADTKSIKAIFDNKNLVDLTIDEVIACTVVGSETEESQGLGKKSKRGRKASERLLSESEIKKEADLDDSKTSLNESSIESDSEILKVSQNSRDMSQNSPDCLKSVFPRTRYNRTSAQRSLRNGKLRGASEFGVSADSESNQQYKLESEDQTGSDTCPGDSSIEIIEGEQFFYDSNLESSQGNMASTKGENQPSLNDRTSSKSFEEDESNGTEAGNNNNNGERGDRASEVGPMLRSKTKAKTTDPTATSLDGKSSVDVKVDEVKTVFKNSGTHDDLKRSGSIELPRKENILVNILEKPKSRRSSLNVEIKKTVGSFYGSDKSDNSKSQIDQMIENIKLNIAKSIESKIFGPEKSLVLNKNFEMTKTEEIIAPLSAELQKKNLEENDEDVNSPNISKNEIKSENSENSVPKVADTAKEIEKMVMGDMKIVDTQSQERQKNCIDNSNVATTSDLIKVFNYADATNSESLCEARPKSDKEELQAGSCSSYLESNKTKDIEPHSGEDKERTMDIIETLENARPTAMSTENTSIASSKSMECNENQSTEVQSLIEIRQCSVKTRNVAGGDGSESSNKDSSDCTLNYQVFEQELRDDRKALTSDMKSNIAESESVAISDNVNTVKKLIINNDKNDSNLKITMQSDESETLESISREVERLVAESDSDNSKITKSMHQPPDEVVQNIENRSPIGDLDNDKTKKSGSENGEKNKTDGDFTDIVDAEMETNKFLETLESSFTDSDILNMAPEITEVLATKELSPSETFCSKETLDSKKFSQESSDDIKSGEIDETVFTIQEKICDHQSILNGQDLIVSSQNLSVTSQSLHDNSEKSSNLPSRSDTHFSRLKETMELENLNVDQKSKSKEQAEMSRDGSMGQENLVKNPEIFDEFNRSIENDRSPTVSGETSSEKQTKNRERTVHASSIKTTNIDASNGEGTMKKDSRLENFEKSTITADEQTCLNEENKRVLRARDRQKKVESGRKSRETVHSSEMIDKMKLIVNISEHVKNTEDADKAEITDKELGLQGNDSGQELTSNKQNVVEQLSNTDDVEKTDADKQETAERGVASGPLIRTRRSREMKKRKDDQQQMHSVQKSKRSKRDNRKLDQQNKEETLLDNEVAKINENTQSLSEKYEKSYKADGNFRGFSEGSSKTIFGSGKVRKNDNDRSHSETDLEMVKLEMEDVELAKKRLGTASAIPDVIENPSRNSETNSENEKKILEHGLKIPDALQKDLDETSTSSESSSSAVITSKILETPEDKLKKESILRILGLESLEKAAERMNHQKAKKEQYTGTLKTVIRVQKEKDKKRSRSPLKMVLKQGRSDGDGDSPEFYTIQKELGTSGLVGDSSSGANRKFSTNHRHSCDEDPEEPPSKDRQSLVIPEKSSSFSIHPGRLCADVCCYCFGKFGSLDTPMHLAQMKSDERRKKILNVERHLTKDSCLCDACYRHVDRKANTSPTNMQNKPQRQHRQLMVSKCSARECREPARHHVKRRWLLKIKAGLHNQVEIDWESSQHTSMSFCVHHYSKIERFLTCALCKRRLARNHTHQLVAVETDELNDRFGQQGIPVPLSAGTFVCKLCRYFTQLQLKYKDVENMNTNHRSFFKSYRKQILHYHDIEVLENEEEDSSSQGQPAKDKDKRKKSKCGQGKSGSTKSVESAQNSTSEKSTPEPSKNEGINFETENDTFVNQNNTTSEKDSEACHDIQILNVEDSIENIKKRKSHDMQSYNNSAAVSCGSASDLVEILALDKEVTLTRLPKKVRTNNDITPVVQRLGANPSISVRTLFPGEEEMNLHANVEFNNVREVTPQGWEKCATMIQYDRDTKLLWQELQRPYGNQSSFLRHLILLEKYYRSGDLVLAPNASRNAINYSTSVQNRLISYEGPEKVDEPILEPIASEFANPRRLSGGFMMERDRFSMPSTSSFLTNTTINSNPTNTISNSSKTSPPRILKLNSGVSIIKKPPPNLHRLNLPSTSTSSMIGSSKNKEIRMPVMSGGKVFQLSEPEYKKLQTLKRQKQMLNEKQVSSANLPTNNSGSVSPSSPHNSSRPATQYQKAQLAAHTQFQKHLRIQQEMLSRQSRSDFEPLICDVRTLANENNPTQNLLSNLNLPKSIQVTTKPTNTIPIMPKIPRSLTVIPQTITKPTEK